MRQGRRNCASRLSGAAIEPGSAPRAWRRQSGSLKGARDRLLAQLQCRAGRVGSEPRGQRRSAASTPQIRQMRARAGPNPVARVHAPTRCGPTLGWQCGAQSMHRRPQICMAGTGMRCCWLAQNSAVLNPAKSRTKWAFRHATRTRSCHRGPCSAHAVPRSALRAGRFSLNAATPSCRSGERTSML